MMYSAARAPSGNHAPLFGLLAFAAIALFLLFSEHRAHFLGVLPYLLLLSCPLMHLFMHHGHGHAHGNGGSVRNANTPEAGDSHEQHR